MRYKPLPLAKNGGEKFQWAGKNAPLNETVVVVPTVERTEDLVNILCLRSLLLREASTI